MAGVYLRSECHCGARARGRCPPDVQLSVLQQIKAADKDQLAVSEEDGRFLRVMIASSGAKHALEIGAADGYSAIWIGLGLRQTGGRLTTIEYDPGARAGRRREHSTRRPRRHRDRRSRRRVRQIPKLAGTVDFVFLDAWKRDYKRFFDLLLPRLEPRGLFQQYDA